VTFRFDPRYGLIIVQAELWGPAGSAVLRLALDTGATSTMANVGLLDRVQVTTGSGVEFVPRVTLDKVMALGQERAGFPVLGHTLPPSSGVDGLLGLDFFRGQRLALDFRLGQASLL
jgi:hypothetical protein